MMYKISRDTSTSNNGLVRNGGNDTMHRAVATHEKRVSRIMAVFIPIYSYSRAPVHVYNIIYDVYMSM